MGNLMNSMAASLMEVGACLDPLTPAEELELKSLEIMFKAVDSLKERRRHIDMLKQRRKEIADILAMYAAARDARADVADQ